MTGLKISRLQTYKLCIPVSIMYICAYVCTWCMCVWYVCMSVWYGMYVVCVCASISAMLINGMSLSGMLVPYSLTGLHTFHVACYVGGTATNMKHVCRGFTFLHSYLSPTLSAIAVHSLKRLLSITDIFSCTKSCLHTSPLTPLGLSSSPDIIWVGSVLKRVSGSRVHLFQ